MYYKSISNLGNEYLKNISCILMRYLRVCILVNDHDLIILKKSGDYRNRHY